MAKSLTIQLTEAAFAALGKKAAEANVPASVLAAETLESQFGTSNGTTAANESMREIARKRFERHFGAVEIGHPAGADNIAIDEDLAREHADAHEDS